MGKIRRSRCRDCQASGNDVHISQAGYCPACSERRLLDHNRQLIEGAGPGFERWALGIARSQGYDITSTQHVSVPPQD